MCAQAMDSSLLLMALHFRLSVLHDSEKTKDQEEHFPSFASLIISCAPYGYLSHLETQYCCLTSSVAA